jgi:hypothetical protein
MRIRSGLPGALLVLALGLSGCGGNDSAGATKATPSASAGGKSTGACTLLTVAELQAKFGSAFGDGVPTHQETGADLCVWTSTNASPAKTFSITVLRQDGLDGDLKSSGLRVPELFEQTKAAYPKAKPLDLGDEAYASPSEVQVLDGDTWYSFSAFLGTGSDAVAVLKDLAAQVVG